MGTVAAIFSIPGRKKNRLISLGVRDYQSQQGDIFHDRWFRELNTPFDDREEVER